MGKKKSHTCQNLNHVALVWSMLSCSPDHNTEHALCFFWRLAFFMALKAMVVASLKTFSMFSRHFAEHSR